MGNSLISYTSNFHTISGNSNDFYPAFNTADNDQDIQENFTKVTYRSPGTFSNFWGRISSNSVSVSTTHTIMKNGATGNETFSVGANTTGTFTDSTHTDTVSAGNNFGIKISLSGNSGTLTPSIYSAIFAASTSANTVTRCLGSDASIYATSSTTMFAVSIGSDEGANPPTTESGSKNRQRKAGTYQNLEVDIFSNSNTNTSTWHSRKNGANGNLTISIGAGSTGIIEDTTHLDTVVAGDDYDYGYTTGSGTVNAEIDRETVDFISTNQDTIFSNTSNGPEQINTGVTTNIGLTGDLISRQATETNTQMLIQLAYVFSELTANVNSNNITSTSTLHLRANGANTSLVVSITSSQTGVISDSNSSDNYTAATTDLVNYQLTTGSTGTNMKLQHVSVWGNLTPATPATPSGFPGNFKNLPPRAGAPKLNSDGLGNQSPVFGI